MLFLCSWTETAAEVAKMVCFADVEVRDSSYALVLVEDRLGDYD